MSSRLNTSASSVSMHGFPANNLNNFAGDHLKFQSAIARANPNDVQRMLFPSITMD